MWIRNSARALKMAATMSPLKDLIVRKHLAVQTSAHEPLIDNYKRVEYCMQVVE